MGDKEVPDGYCGEVRSKDVGSEAGKRAEEISNDPKLIQLLKETIRNRGTEFFLIALRTQALYPAKEKWEGLFAMGLEFKLEFRQNGVIEATHGFVRGAASQTIWQAKDTLLFMKEISELFTQQSLNFKKQRSESMNSSLNSSKKQVLSLLLNLGVVGAGIYVGRKDSGFSKHSKKSGRFGSLFVNKTISLTAVKTAASWSKLILEEVGSSSEITPRQRKLISKAIQYASLFADGFSISKKSKFPLDRFFENVGKT